MTIKQQGGIFGRNPTFNDVDATDITSSTVTATNITSSTVSATTSVSTPVETISGNTSAVSFASNSAGMLFSGGTDVTKYSGIVFRGGNSWNTFLGRIPDASFDPLVIGNDAISAFGAMCTFGYSDVTINRGNLVIGTSGQGIDFSATSGTGTSELFDDYEEGSWTPVLTASGGGASSSSFTGAYTKIGNVVYYYALMNDSASNNFGTGDLTVTGLPYTVNSNSTVGQILTRQITAPSTSTQLLIQPISTTINIWWSGTDGGGLTRLNASHVSTASQVFFRFSGFYYV